MVWKRMQWVCTAQWHALCVQSQTQMLDFPGLTHRVGLIPVGLLETGTWDPWGVIVFGRDHRNGRNTGRYRGAATSTNKCAEASSIGSSAGRQLCKPGVLGKSRLNRDNLSAAS